MTTLCEPWTDELSEMDLTVNEAMPPAPNTAPDMAEGEILPTLGILARMVG